MQGILLSAAALAGLTSLAGVGVALTHSRDSSPRLLNVIEQQINGTEEAGGRSVDLSAAAPTDFTQPEIQASPRATPSSQQGSDAPTFASAADRPKKRPGTLGATPDTAQTAQTADVTRPASQSVAAAQRPERPQPETEPAFSFGGDGADEVIPVSVQAPARRTPARIERQIIVVPAPVTGRDENGRSLLGGPAWVLGAFR